jgi:NDP-sugar pyrophosphorylase family protein
MKDKVSITIDRMLLGEVDRLVDHVSIKNRSHAIEYLVRRAVGERRAAVILCGGAPELLRLGRGYRPTVELNKKKLIEYTLEKLSDNQFKRIFIVGRKQVLTAVFEAVKGGADYGVEIDYVEEKASKGTAASLRLIRERVTTPFLGVYGDVLITKARIDELWDAHLKTNVLATLILNSSPAPSKKGIVRLEGSRILNFTQKPKQAEVYIGFSSMFVAEPDLLSFPGDWLELDVFPELAKRGLLGGYVSSEAEIHIHTAKDALMASKLVQQGV